MSGLVLMLFIYWGWDTSLSINEETTDKKRLPGLAGIIATVILLAVYFVVTLSSQSFAGVGSKGLGLANPNNVTDVFAGLGHAVFGSTGVGPVFFHLLILMVLTSAMASTQTTILPTARTALSMAVYKSIPSAFARMHTKNMIPTVATVVMGAISVVMYAAMNFMAGGNIIADSVTAIGIFIAFYYGLTGFTCVWYYRKVLTRSRRDLWMKGISPSSVESCSTPPWATASRPTGTSGATSATRRGSSPSPPTGSSVACSWCSSSRRSSASC